MNKGILDTNIVVDILNAYAPAQAWYRQIHELIEITPVVYYEVLSGANNKFHMQQLMKFLTAFPMEYSDSNDQDWGMNIFRQYISVMASNSRM